MTMFEFLLIVPIMTALLVFEMFKSDPRAQLHKPTDESPFFVELFKDDESVTEPEVNLSKSMKSKR